MAKKSDQEPSVALKKSRRRRKKIEDEAPASGPEPSLFDVEVQEPAPVSAGQPAWPSEVEVGDISVTQTKVAQPHVSSIKATEEKLPPPIIAVPTMVTNIPLQLLLGEGEEWTPVKGLNLVSQYPLFTVDKQVRARRCYVITQTVDQQYKQDVTVTLEPGLSDEGLASIEDADILKYAVSIARKRMIEKYGENDPDWMRHWMANRRVEFLITDFLSYTKRQKTGSAYDDVANALRRLTGMQIKIHANSFATDVKSKQREQLESQFSIVDSFSFVTRESITKSGARRKVQYAQVTFNDWIWAYAGDPFQLLTFSNDFFFLSTFKKGVYEKVRKSLGKQPFFMIRMKNLAARMGYLITKEDDDDAEENIDKAALASFKRMLKEMIADDDLLDIKCALEAKRTRPGEEMLVFYPRNWKQRLVTEENGECKTELEVALHTFGGEQRVHWFFKQLLHTDDIRKKFSETSRWFKRMEKTRSLFEKREKGEKLTPADSARLAFLDRIHASENRTASAALPRAIPSTLKKPKMPVADEPVPIPENEGLFTVEPLPKKDEQTSHPAKSEEVPDRVKEALANLRESIRKRRNKS